MCAASRLVSTLSGRPHGVTRIVLVQLSFYRFDNSYILGWGTRVEPGPDAVDTPRQSSVRLTAKPGTTAAHQRDR
jgi:hypothetical protein